MDHYCRLNSG